jgi:hypothetical protein
MPYVRHVMSSTSYRKILIIGKITLFLRQTFLDVSEVPSEANIFGKSGGVCWTGEWEMVMVLLGPPLDLERKFK